MLTASSRSVSGSLRQDVLVDGLHRIVTDEPPAVGGEGSAPAPHELLPAAVAACISTTIVMYARTKDWEVPGVQVDVEYDNTATPRHFRVRVHLDGDLTDEQVARLEKVAAACPVRRALEAGVEFDETVERARPLSSAVAELHVG